LTRRDSKSGGGVVPDVETTGGDTARSAASVAWHVAQKRNVAQIDRAVAFNMVKTHRKPN
jgi:hypothetical protein